MNTLVWELSKPTLLLAGFALAGTLLLAGVHTVTAKQIAESERQALLTRINTLVEASRYDNNPLEDTLSLAATELNSSEPVLVYRLRKQNQPVAAVFTTTTPDGYSGNIRLVVGVNADQTLAGVRVLAHKETPGLGDWIDVEKSDWILGFSGKSLQNPTETAWSVKKDGGEFDQFTGATITPRAVVAAVKQVLVWSGQHTDTLFAPSTGKQP
ncbi:electron transport complex subunit RsxG [uncultured Thiothrix sp.]|uniref:electron transport complex subunit RsxG n=1 Tax=uncultured Thiothrix sp. TaxID=223185 RepID=UPI00260D8735|nr:electron transport complex subunit RsxG [uncultured Thiothrix sp.]